MLIKILIKFARFFTCKPQSIVKNRNSLKFKLEAAYSRLFFCLQVVGPITGVTGGEGELISRRFLYFASLAGCWVGCDKTLSQNISSDL